MIAAATPGSPGAGIALSAAPILPPAAPCAVIDSNIVLDWLLFRDPACGALANALEAGRLRWCATSAMRDELAHVLARNPGLGGEAAGRAEAVAAGWARWAQPAAAPLLPFGARLPCTDPDDQKFIDLAIGLRARWLFTRDRALLKLARRARRLGVEIRVAAGWELGESAATPTWQALTPAHPTDAEPAHRDRGRSSLTGPLPHHPACGSAPGGSRS